MTTFAETVAKGRISVQDRFNTLTARQEKRTLTQVEVFELKRVEHALRELDALDRARERGKKADALQMVWLQMDELNRANLDYSCLNPDDVIAVNAKASR